MNETLGATIQLVVLTIVAGVVICWAIYWDAKKK